MISFVRFEDGQIVEGPIAADEIPPGFVEYKEIVDLPPTASSVTITLELVDGVCVKTISGQVSYAIQRQQEYPLLGDQLDSIWHAMNSGIFPKIEPMYSQIKEVKDRYPKPV